MPAMHSFDHGKICTRQLPGSQPGFLRSYTLAALLGLWGIFVGDPGSDPVAADGVSGQSGTSSRQGHSGRIDNIGYQRRETVFSALFGWTYTDTNAGDTTYSQASLDGRPVAGSIQHTLPTGEHKPPASLNVFSVNDVDVAKKPTLAYRAAVLRDVYDLPARSR